MFDFCSHKTFNEKCANYDSALLLYQTEEQLKDLVESEDFPDSSDVCCVQYATGQPSNAKYGLPCLKSVLSIVEFIYEKRSENLLICDTNGKGPCTAIAVVKESYNLGGVRSAVKSSETYENRPIDLFFLKLVDALTGSSFSTSVLNFTNQVKYFPVKI